MLAKGFRVREVLRQGVFSVWGAYPKTLVELFLNIMGFRV